MESRPGTLIQNPVLFVCDLQEKFRSAIYEFDKIVGTTQKMIQASEVLSFPIIATTQNAPRLGPLVPELRLNPPPADANIKLLAPVIDKTLFSMITPDVEKVLSSHSARLASIDTGKRMDAIIVGIESHICVTQTALDLLARGYGVYVLADGVSSCNKEEVPIALRRLQSAGATVTTSESLLYEVMRDASIPQFKQIAALVRDSKSATTAALQALAKI